TAQTFRNEGNSTHFRHSSSVYQGIFDCFWMVMDAKDIQLDLHALKSLYGLLEKDRNRTSNADSLDEHARLLLNNLLDAETKRVLKLHSEIISGEVELSRKQVTPLSKSLKSNRSFDKDTNTDGLLDITLWGPPSFSGAQTRKKRCRVCLRNTVKEPTEDDETIFFDVAQNLNSDEETYESKELDCLSKEASEAIKKIELCISAFDIWADHLHHFEEGNNISAQTRFRDFDTRQNNFLSEFSNQRFVDLPIMTSAEKTNPPQSTNNYIVDNVESSYHGSTMVARGKNESKKAPQYDEIPTNKRAAKTYIQDQESESTSSDSYSNSPYSDSEEYSSPDKTREQLQYGSTTSSTSSEIGASLTSHSGDTSNTEEEDEFYSSDSSDAAAREVTSSSKSEGYSSYLSVGPTSKKSSRKKQIGMWRSLKDRLAVIFHHHHHHHHHHHDDYCGKDGRKKMSRNKSLRKGRVESFKREHEAYGEKASKSVVREKKKNHFNGLVEGLLRHVRNSKKEPTKKKKKRGNENGCRQLTKGGGKKNSKKPSPHWLKLMKLHRGGKLTNKGLVTIGLGKKKARLKALPTIK
ncbi:hypothetical protein MIMGU_mgv1a0031691mg, partial [Erythranthe guttata]